MALTPFFSDSWDVFPWHDWSLTPFTHGGLSHGGGGALMNQSQSQRNYKDHPITNARYDWNQLLAEPLSLSLNEEKDNYVMEITPSRGFAKQYVKVNVQDNVLRVSGEYKKEEKKVDDPRVGNGGDHRQTSHRVESCNFVRSLRLPANVDQSAIRAKWEGERMVIRLPKLPPKTEGGRQIMVE